MRVLPLLGALLLTALASALPASAAPAAQVPIPFACVEPSPGTGACAGYLQADYDFDGDEEWGIVVGACFHAVGLGCPTAFLVCGDYSLTCNLEDRLLLALPGGDA